MCSTHQLTVASESSLVVVELSGIERGGLPSLTVSGSIGGNLIRSVHFTFTFLVVVELSGIEPLTSCVQGRRSPS